MKALIFAILLSLPQRLEDRGDPRKIPQLEALADGIEWASSTPEDRAALIMLAYWESGLSLRVHEGTCREYECDHGRARGPWQVHRNGINAAAWAMMVGITYTHEQAAEALWRWHKAFDTCKTIDGAVAVYMGQGCYWTSVNTRARVRDYNRFLSRLRREFPIAKGEPGGSWH